MTVGLVQLFGGEFKIQSQVGQGTECEFTGTFLKQQSPKEHAADEQARQKLASRRVMIAVANDTSRRWLTEACQQMGMEVIVSEPGLAAARACAAEAAPPVEMALVDESLFDLAASPQDRLRAMSDLAVAKVILSTPGNAPTSAAPEAANIVATVAKPWFAEDLQRALLAAVDNLDAQTPRRPYDNVSPEKANQDIHGKESNKERSMLQCEPKEAIARLGGDDELYGEVVRRFRDEGPKVLQTLRRHLESGNADVLHRAAHSFKGLAAMSGAAAVALQAAEIERLGRQGDLQQVEPLLNTLAAAIQQANVELATYM
jgi:HPt (histidine-containing phosphotransfer) domain-containing protein/CheY-like chemotaxis protein